MKAHKIVEETNKLISKIGKEININDRKSYQSMIQQIDLLLKNCTNNQLFMESSDCVTKVKGLGKKCIGGLDWNSKGKGNREYYFELEGSKEMLNMELPQYLHSIGIQLINEEIQMNSNDIIELQNQIDDLEDTNIALSKIKKVVFCV